MRLQNPLYQEYLKKIKEKNVMVSFRRSNNYTAAKHIALPVVWFQYLKEIGLVYSLEPDDSFEFKG